MPDPRDLYLAYKALSDLENDASRMVQKMTELHEPLKRQRSLLVLASMGRNMISMALLKTTVAVRNMGFMEDRRKESRMWDRIVAIGITFQSRPKYIEITFLPFNWKLSYAPWLSNEGKKDHCFAEIRVGPFSLDWNI